MTHLPKGIYRRGSSYYLSYRDENGKLIRRSAGKDLQKAIERLRMVHRDRAQSNGSFAAIFDSYLERQEVYSKRRSVKNARSFVNRLLEHFGDVEIASFRRADLDRFVSGRRAQGVANKTINGDLIILRAALNHALAVGLIDVLPFKVKLLKVSRKRCSRCCRRAISESSSATPVAAITESF